MMLMNHFKKNKSISCRSANTRRHAAFSIIELLVVIGIISVLAAILLIALGKARSAALKTNTLSTMQNFAQSAEVFQTDHQQYPGILPERVLAAMDVPPLTSTENALLHMAGGARILSPADAGTGNATEIDYNNFLASPANEAIEIPITDVSGQEWKLAIDLDAGGIGEGPVVRGKAYEAYYSPGSDNVISVAPGQLGAGGDIPDVLDAFGQPIIYLRQMRKVGPLVAEIGDVASGAALPQYCAAGMFPYSQATNLGEKGISQVDGGTSTHFSTFNIGSDSEMLSTLALLVGHPTLGDFNAGIFVPEQARGGFTLLSAGKDGVYLDRTQGPASIEAPIGAGTDISNIHAPGPSILDEFDDIRVYGGDS